MYAHIGFVICFVVGSSVAYYPQREAPYNTGANDPYAEVVGQNAFQHPSQRLFWGQGSNSVGGTGLWATLTNKFPILGNMFGRLEMPATQYGVPNQYNAPSVQYGTPGGYQQQQQPQYYQDAQFYQQVPQQWGQRFVPRGRDVSFTDDAVIVTNPFVPSAPAPSPIPAPAPVPAPVPVPEPSQPAGGYTYDKPQYRLELPHK